MQVLGRFYELLCVILASTAVRNVEGTAGQVIGQAEWQALCKISENLARFYAKHELKLKAALEKDFKHSLDEYRVRILIEMKPQEEAARLLPLLISSNSKRYSDVADLQEGVAAALKATRDVSFLHGHIVEFITVAVSTFSTGGNHGCLMGSVAAIQGTTKIGACGLHPLDTAQAAEAGFDHSHLKLFGPETHAQTDATLTDGTGKTCMLTKAATGGGLMGSNALTATLPYGAGYFYLKSDGGDLYRHAIPAFAADQTSTDVPKYVKARNSVRDYSKTALSQKKPQPSHFE
uniref:Variant surface glycoprotein 1125.1544 n=1 Tax=Trypanosoma brucei TaxID=5691 RepID=A0A1J0R7G0_9TRYP|nr:variant surface glycoprotein 1125.1544 [Trypanosoma brucei]